MPGDARPAQWAGGVGWEGLEGREGLEEGSTKGPPAEAGRVEGVGAGQHRHLFLGLLLAEADTALLSVLLRHPQLHLGGGGGEGGGRGGRG